MTERLTEAQAQIASFLAKFADFSYERKEAAEQLDPAISIENGWLVRSIRKVSDPVSGLDFSIFSRISDDGALDIAVALRGAQVTWRPQLADVGAGLLRGGPQWQRSRDLFLRKLLVPARSAILSGGAIYITGQSMGHMLMQFAAAELAQRLANDAKLAHVPPRQIAQRIHGYGFGGVGVATWLPRLGLDSTWLAGADIKHFIDSWDPAQLLRWTYVGDEGGTWTAPKPYAPVPEAWRRAMGGARFNLTAPLAFLWHLFYTAHSVTGYNASDFTRSERRQNR
jgi:hypothetical protein